MYLQQASLNSVLAYPLHTTPLPAAATLRPRIGLIRRSQSHRQSRAYRIGFRSTYLDPVYLREIQQHQRTMKRKYIEASNQSLLWNRSTNFMNLPPVKNFMCSAWHGASRRHRQRWAEIRDIDYFKQPKGSATATLETTAQTSINALLKTHNEIIEEMLHKKARFFGPSSYSSRSRDTKNAKSPQSAKSSSSLAAGSDSVDQTQAASSIFNLEYEIDPITNRKVYRNAPTTPGDLFRKAVELSNSTSKAILSQIQSINPFASDPARESLKEYEGKSKEDYSPVYYKEPDGKDPPILCTVKAALKEYDDMHIYSPVYYKEPDGKDPVQSCSVQRALSEYDSRVSYGPVYYREPDGQDPIKICSVTEGLKAFDSKTPYGPVFYNEPDGKAPEKLCSVQKGLRDYDDRITYGPLMYQEPDGKLPEKSCPVQSSLADFDSSANYTYSNAPTENESPKMVPPRDEKIEDLDLLRTSDVRAASGILKATKIESGDDKSRNRQKLEQDFKNGQRQFLESLEINRSELLNHVAHARARVNAKIAEIDAEQEAAKSPRLTGNYIKDFPEDFKATWTSSQSGSGVLIPDNIETVQHKSASHVRATSDDPKLETALDRSLDITSSPVSSTGATNPGLEEQSKRNLERGTHRDLVREIRKIYEDKYGVIDKTHRQSTTSNDVANSAGSPALSESPTLYKILAYDPTMQSISEAETTSIVADSSTPLTPAEVLLRLSNPAKFFPHFAPLQQQGYEILTGGGDVLVFRKVREASAVLPAAGIPTPTRETRHRLNPIDGMQPIAATGNFASPTGFVNHDLPQEESETEDARSTFKSNIDVRREEPLFSGKHNWQSAEKRQRRMGGRAKKVVLGAFWLGACSYAIGVVAQFVKNH